MKRLVVPAREGRAFMVTAGQTVTVVDIEGQQVADLFCFGANDPCEYLSAEHTRVALGRLFPHVGQRFESNRHRAILTLVADDSPGVHDMLCAACTPERYQLLGAEGWHASCEENLRSAPPCSDSPRSTSHSP
ncbi:MAG: urea carboxylase-associated family protein [Thermoleophilia bacterium]